MLCVSPLFHVHFFRHYLKVLSPLSSSGVHRHIPLRKHLVLRPRGTNEYAELHYIKQSQLISTAHSMGDSNSGIPAHLAKKSIPAEKIFYIIAGLEHEGLFKATTFRAMSAASGGRFSESALEFTLREWRKAARNLANGKGNVEGNQVKDKITTSRTRKGKRGDDSQR